MNPTGLEPATSRLIAERSDALSYELRCTPKCIRRGQDPSSATRIQTGAPTSDDDPEERHDERRDVVERMGIEPITAGLQDQLARPWYMPPREAAAKLRDPRDGPGANLPGWQPGVRNEPSPMPSVMESLERLPRWSGRGSNSRPPACHTDALPTELPDHWLPEPGARERAGVELLAPARVEHAPPRVAWLGSARVESNHRFPHIRRASSPLDDERWGGAAVLARPGATAGRSTSSGSTTAIDEVDEESTDTKTPALRHPREGSHLRPAA